MSRQRKAYFYAGASNADATLYHEATHQLFHESRRSHRAARDDVGFNHNFWIIEGIALYMESLQQHAGYLTVGGVDAPRLQFARHNALCGGFYVPLKQFVELGRIQLQTDERIRLLYSQAAGLTHFLMDGASGRYRDTLVEFLRSVYDRTDQPGTLEQLTGQPYASLDRQYRESLIVDDTDLAGILAPRTMQRLLLGRTAVTDEGVRNLAGAVQLRDLNLDGTSITDETLRVIGNLHQLEELDLSSTHVTDQGLEELQRLKRLRVLWLSNTKISDEGLIHLANLKSLEQLHTDRTRVTPQGLKSLGRSLPSLSTNSR